MLGGDVVKLTIIIIIIKHYIFMIKEGGGGPGGLYKIGIINVAE